MNLGALGKFSQLASEQMTESYQRICKALGSDATLPENIACHLHYTSDSNVVALGRAESNAFFLGAIAAALENRNAPTTKKAGK